MAALFRIDQRRNPRTVERDPQYNVVGRTRYRNNGTKHTNGGECAERGRDRRLGSRGGENVFGLRTPRSRHAQQLVVVIRFSFPFCRSPFSPFFSFCIFVVSFSVGFLYHLRFFFSPASLLSLVAESVLMSRCYTPPRATWERTSMGIPLACCLRFAFFIFFASFFFFLPFVALGLDVVCFILSFSCGNYAVSSVLVSAATRLAYDTLYVSDTYVR